MNAVTEDELFIRRMLEQYMRLNDDRALDRLVSLFAPDAIYGSGVASTSATTACASFSAVPDFVMANHGGPTTINSWIATATGSAATPKRGGCSPSARASRSRRPPTRPGTGSHRLPEAPTVTPRRGLVR